MQNTNPDTNGTGGPTLLEVLQRIEIQLRDLNATLNGLTEKGGKESSPLIPPLKESPKKKSPQSARARVREEEPVLSAMFDGFWEAYPSNCPRKSNKAKCLKKYISLLKAVKDPAALHNAILDGLARWKRCVDWTEDDGKFIKAPLVWLNNENWEDSPKAVVADAEEDSTYAADMVIANGIAAVLGKEAAL